MKSSNDVSGERVPVALVHCPSYEREVVRDAVEHAVELCCGWPVGTAESVLIKPNLLAPKSLDRAVTTHPEVVRAVAESIRSITRNISIGDSPGLSTASQVMNKTGIAEIAEELALQMVEFSEIEKLSPEFSPFSLELAKSCLQADHVINLAKFKSHGQMLLTLAVKNMFGCVVGQRKAQWHMRAGVNYEYFARMLVDVCRAVAPSFQIIDGITAMQGEGPGNGEPRPLHVIIAGRNPFAVDAAACRVVGIAPQELYTLKIAAKLGIFGANLDDVEFLGTPLEKLQVQDFKRPGSHPLLFGPLPLRRLFRECVAPRPVIDKAACKNCMVCAEACPAGIISAGEETPWIDPEKCIRCYCCQELCPHGAVTTRRNWVFSVLDKFLRLTSGR